MQEWQEASSMIEKLIRFGNPDDTSAPDAQRI
jgi:hypothetical protein